VLIHGYGQIDDHLVWSIVQTKLPALVRDATELARDLGIDRLTRTIGQFERYVGIDYSGAGTAAKGLSGLCVYVAASSGEPERKSPDGKTRWSRLDVAHWLAELLSDGVPTLVGIDHGFSFPLQYFERYGIEQSWPAFLDDFIRHWPTDGASVSVQALRAESERRGENGWRRMTEIRAKAKSVFHFDVQGSVAKSTHAGLPWLRYIRTSARPMPHFWPFDGWDIETGRSAIVEVYPRLWSGDYDVSSERNTHQHDAYSVARWLRDADGSAALAAALRGPVDETARAAALIEGWILGVR
jgi:hypothetical protein